MTISYNPANFPGCVVLTCNAKDLDFDVAVVYAPKAFSDLNVGFNLTLADEPEKVDAKSFETIDGALADAKLYDGIEYDPEEIELFKNMIGML